MLGLTHSGGVEGHGRGEVGLNSSLGIFDKVNRYLAGEIGIPDLETWVVAHIGEVLSDPRSTAYQLAGTIELGLAELSAGDINEQEFRELLREFELTHPVVVVSIPGNGNSASSSNSTVATPSPYVAFGVRADQPVRYERIRLGEAT